MLVGVLRRSQQTGRIPNSWLTLGRTVAPLPDVGRSGAAALICGWLDGRTDRVSDNMEVHEAAVAAVRRSFGRQWETCSDRLAT